MRSRELIKGYFDFYIKKTNTLIEKNTQTDLMAGLSFHLEIKSQIDQFIEMIFVKSDKKPELDFRRFIPN